MATVNNINNNTSNTDGESSVNNNDNVRDHPVLRDIDPDDNFFNEVFRGLSEHETSQYYTVDRYNETFGGTYSSFRCMTVNIRSFKKNIDMFTSTLSALSMKQDIIVLTETWIDAGSVDFHSLEGYTSFHCTREGRSGGVSLYCADNHVANRIVDLSVSTAIIESCVVEVVYGGDNFVIFAIYRPHSGSIEEFSIQLDRMLQSNILRGKTVIVVGDLNVDLLKVNNNQTSNFVDSMRSLNYLPVISRATRFPVGEAAGCPALLDHIWFNSIRGFDSGIINVDLTDHCPVFINVRTSFNPDQKIKLTFRLHHFQYIEKFKIELEKLTNAFMFDGCINTQTSKFLMAVNELYRKCFPLKNKYVSSKRLCNPWITAGILRSIKTKSTYFKLYKLGIIDEHLNRAYRNRLNTIIRQAKREYYRNVFNNCKNDMKRTWSAIRTLLAKKTRPTSVRSILVDGVAVGDASQICEHFNVYFSNVAEKLDRTIPQSDKSPLDYVTTNMQSSFLCYPTNKNEVANIIQNLKNTTANINELPVRVLKLVKHIVAAPISKLINKSVTEGIFPNVLKCAKIVPIFKNGNTQDVSNYRPIAILPTLSKIFERVMSCRLINYLVKFNLITDKQFGFLKGNSTEDAFVKLVEHVYSRLNAKEHCISLFIDLKKAFDTVNHKILLDKLKHYGVRGPPLSWMASYLKDRKQQVVIAGRLSSEKTLNVGVPQGSILGPILFLLYINDMPNVSSLFFPILYADDTTLLSSNNDYDALILTINNELPKLYTWTTANRLSLNLGKTYAMLFSNRKQNINYDLSIYFNNVKIKFKKNEDFLGLTIDNEARFSEHIGFVCSKLSKAVGLIYKLREYVPKEVLGSLYYSLAYPYILYGNLVWGGTYDAHLHPLIILQKKLLRLITYSDFLAHTEPLFKRTSILKVTDVHTLVLAQYMYKQRQVGAVRVEGLHAYDTRGQYDVRPAFQRLSLTQHSIHYAAPVVWNSLPASIRECETFNVFKSQIKHYLLERYRLPLDRE